jgi:UDP-N-acetylglucosamine--N-acetylmuramyl-(pentapeptide) pyrophosphoryl-undecaprenol N-acetylglucosamine transferase
MRILAVAGSSGGHIFPALALLDALKERIPELEQTLVLPRRNICDEITARRYNIGYISVRPFKRGLNFYNLLSLARFIEGTFESLSLLVNFRPDIVIGFGSIASVPLIFFAWMFRIKTLIHEQNAIPGQANRFLARFSDRIAVSFDRSKESLESFKGKVVFTGNPIRMGLRRLDKKSSLDFFGFRKDRFTVLVMGGSQGSSSINRGFVNALVDFPKRDRLQVIHLSGAADEEFLKKRYGELGVAFKIFSFFDQMQYAYSAADLAVCRAGAATIHELINFRLPAVIIPYPFAHNHQATNAVVLQEKGCAIMIDDKDAGSPKMRNILNDLISGPEKLESMASNYSNFKNTDAAGLLADEVLNINRP